MKNISRFILIALSLIVLWMSTACLITSFGKIGDLLKKSTEIPTMTVTQTPKPLKPTNTPIPATTPTESLPLDYSPCAFKEDCPNVHSIRDYHPEDYQIGEVIEIEIPYDEPVWFTTGWFTSDDAALADNMGKLEWFFTIDGIDYFQDDWLQSGVIPEDADETILYPGYWFGVVLRNWKIDEPHLVNYGYTVKQDLNDGWDDYAAGDLFKWSYYVTPVREVHLKPTATKTQTP